MRDSLAEWRLAATGGLAVGLGVAPHLGSLPAPGRSVLVGLLALLLLGRERSLSPFGFLIIFLAVGLAGLGLGGARMEAIDSGALEASPNTKVRTSGYLLIPPRTSSGLTRSVLGTPGGRVFLEATRLPRELGVGDQVEVRGALFGAEAWQAGRLKLLGTAMVLRTARVKATGRTRGGIPGVVDGLRRRAEATLSKAIPEREAALARGFVLGQDQDIPSSTVRDFRDSGLAHLLAVSGQNVVLLGLLAIPFLALIGLRSRARLLALAAIILIYIPVAGGGPSIQRAGVMGLAVLAAAAVDRPVMRAWSLSLAAVVTLALNPLAATDPGWQLSFAAVIGIAALAGPISRRLNPSNGAGTGSLMRTIADGFGVTVAASLVTLPLIAFHFGRIPIATVTANLLAMPAVAPSMWLGMAAGAIGQFFPTLAVPLNLANSVLLGFIAQVAEWFGGQNWSALEVGIDSLAELAGAYLILGAVSGLGLAISRPSSEAPGARGRGSSRLVAVAIAMTLLVVAPVLAGHLEPGRRTLAAPPPGGVRIEFLDVGQGDAILVRPDGVDPVLVDFGPPGAGILDALRSASIERLSAAVLTHMDLDHAGGMYEVLDSIPVETLIHDDLDRRATVAAGQAGTDLLAVTAGDRFRFGTVDLEVLWPPPRAAGTELPDSERNSRSVVLMVVWGNRRILLTGDAEAEEVPLVPGDLDVLKLAHHGSDDAGLVNLLANARPELGIISAGAGNRHGHPTDAVLRALAEADTGILRTDRHGTLSVVFGGPKPSVETGR